MDTDQWVILGHPATHVITTVLVVAALVSLLYCLWTWPCGEKEERVDRKYTPLLPEQSVKPLYALELEPGLLVLQSEDGEFFRILREYDTADRRGYGSTSLDVPARRDSNPQPYLPSYTRAHFQTQPTAPLSGASPYGAAPSGAESPGAPPPYGGPFGDGAPWAPISTLGKTP